MSAVTFGRCNEREPGEPTGGGDGGGRGGGWWRKHDRRRVRWGSWREFDHGYGHVGNRSSRL